MGKVGNASVYRVWVLPPHPAPCPALSGIMFDESVPFYRLFPYRTAPLPPLLLFLEPGPPPVDPLPPHSLAPSSVSQVDPVEPVKVAVDSGAAGGGATRGATARGAEQAGAGPGGTEPACTEPGVAESESAEPGGAELGGAEPERAEPGGAEPGGTLSPRGPPAGGSAARGSGALGPRGIGAAGAGGTAEVGAEGIGVGGAGGIGAGAAGVTGAVGPGGARTGGTGAAGGTGAVGPVGARAGGTGATGAGGAAGVGDGDPGAGDTGAGGAGPGNAGAVGAGFGAAVTPMSHPASPVRVVCTCRRVSRPRPPPVLGTRHMALRPSSVPQRVPLPSSPASSLSDSPDPESNLARAATTACRLHYATSLVAESESDSPPSVGGECTLGTDVLEDRQEDFECLAGAEHHLVSMLIAPEGDPYAPDIPTPRSYAEAITVPPPRANIVDGMWIFRVKRPPGSPPTFKACYVARGFSQRQGVDFFRTFSPTPKMTTLQGSLHEEIWLRRSPGFTGSFPAGTQWSLRQPVYGLRQAPRDWLDTLRTMLAALGFSPSTADPSLFLCNDTSLPPFYVLVYVEDLVFATADTEALALVKLELQKRHTCTDLGELRSYIGLQITRDRARRTITLTQSHMVHQVLQRFGFWYSLPHSTPPTGHSLSAPPSDESVDPSGTYPALVGCLMYLMTCTRRDLAYPLSILARYVAPERHRPKQWEDARRVFRYLCSMSGMGLVLVGQGPVVLTRHEDASWVDDLATQQLQFQG
ncbi:unnamed protein product [Closterium sp. NIES-53]